MKFSKPRKSELQCVYDKYNRNFQFSIKVPENLCKLYDFHRGDILKDYKGYYANKERNNQEIFNFCVFNLFFFHRGSREMCDKELVSVLHYASNPFNARKYLKISRHPNPGHSAAEIYILHGNNNRKSRIAKIFKGRSLEDLRLGFLELSNSLVALSLNPDPSNIKMARILSAGYTYFSKTRDPFIFCMILEMAPGKSIKELLRNKYIYNPDLFNETLIDSAQYLAHFHANSYKEFTKNNKVDTDVKNIEIKDREKFCRRRVQLLLQDLGFSPGGDHFINFKDALKNIEAIFYQGVQTPINDIQPQPSNRNSCNGQENQNRNQIKSPNNVLKGKIEVKRESKSQTNFSYGRSVTKRGLSAEERGRGRTPKVSNGNFHIYVGKPHKSVSEYGQVMYQAININPTLNKERISVGQHLTDILRKFENWHLAEEDRVLTHGDMHIGNLCYEKGYRTAPLRRSTMIDFSSLKRTFGAIGDPAQDVGKYLGSIWKEVALCIARNYGDKNFMEYWYNTLCNWQEVFLDTYINVYIHSASSFINQTSSNHLKTNIMVNFRERVYFYKLCLYAQFFDDKHIGIDAKELLSAKQILFYFLLHESDLLGSRNLELTSKDPVYSPNSFLVDFSLARSGSMGSNIMLDGSCYVFRQA